MQRYNSQQNNTPLSISQANEFLNNKKSYQDKHDINRAFKLAKHDEEVKKANNGWMSSFKQLF